MGGFNLKTAPDYKIPEHMRINAAKKEEELEHLDTLVLTHDFHDNEAPWAFYSAKTTHFLNSSIRAYGHRTLELEKTFMNV